MIEFEEIPLEDVPKRGHGKRTIVDYEAIAQVIRRGGALKLPVAQGKTIKNLRTTLQGGLLRHGIRVRINVVDGFIFVSPRKVSDE